MGTYSDWEWREMEAREAERDDKRRPAATPRGSFTDWVLANARPMCPVTDEPCTRGCDPTDGPCERDAEA